MIMDSTSATSGSIILYLDSILVPLSLFFTIGYHAYLWHKLKHKPSLTTIGINTLKRRALFRELISCQATAPQDDKKGTLAVQSLRNTLMFTILTATVTVIITISLAALTNNALKANRLLLSMEYLFGSQSGRIMVLKFGSVSLFLVASFFCSSIAVGCLVDANFLVNAIGSYDDHEYFGGGYTLTVLERGFMLAVVGNRVLCIAFPLLMWLFGPLPVLVSSLALVWGLYELDFVPTTSFSRLNA